MAGAVMVGCGDDDGDSSATKLDRVEAAAAPADEALGNEQLRRLFREKLEAFGKTLADERRFRDEFAKVEKRYMEQHEEKICEHP